MIVEFLLINTRALLEKKHPFPTLPHSFPDEQYYAYSVTTPQRFMRHTPVGAVSEDSEIAVNMIGDLGDSWERVDMVIY